MRAPHWKLFSELVQRHIGNSLPLGVKNILKAAKGKQNRLSARTAGFVAFFSGRETIRPIFWKLTEVYKLIFDISYKTEIKSTQVLDSNWKKYSKQAN